MGKNTKQDVRMIFKVGAFLAFIMLSYLGLRSYRKSVERLQTNACTEEIIELVKNVQAAFNREKNFGELDYKIAAKMKLFPKRMMREGFSEPVNSFIGGVDIFYSSLSLEQPNGAFEISFQGLSKTGCVSLIKNYSLLDLNLIAVGGFGSPTPAGALDEIYGDTKQEDIKKSNIIKAQNVRNYSNEKIERACSCGDDVCSVVWKFGRL